LRKISPQVSLALAGLKAFYPAEAVTDCAALLCVKEVLEFKVRYPLLAASKRVREQLALNVMRRLELLYPSVRRPHVEEVTGLR
jgi:hypothetical protein